MERRRLQGQIAAGRRKIRMVRGVRRRRPEHRTRHAQGETTAKDKAANRFVPKSGTTFTEFSCNVIPIIVRGAVLNPLTSNAMKGFPTPVTVKFTGAKGKQKPSKFVGGPEETLESSIEGGPFEKSDQVLTTLQKNEEKLEVSTVS